MSPSFHFLRRLPKVVARSLSTAAPSPSPPQSYRVTPPIKPWPQRLYPKRLIAMLTRQQNLDLALQIFRYAADFHPGFAHTYHTYLALVRRLAHARAFPAAESLLADLRDSGLKCGEDIFIALIRCYGLAGRPQQALDTFARIASFRVRRSVRSLNCLLNALVQNRRCDMIRWVFENCRERFGVVPNVFTGNILIKALCNEGDLEGALKVLDEMPAMGMVPNVVTYTTVMGGYVARGDLVGAKGVFGEILDRGWMPDATAYTVLMDGYVKGGRLRDAIKVMDEMEENGVPANEVTYGVMITAYCKENKPGEALNLLEDMLQGNHIPSPALCCKVIDALCEQGKVDEACYLWKRLLKNHCTPDNAISSTLIHWLCKNGKVWEARKLFDQFEKGSIPSVLTYNTLIAGMCEEGELCEAGRLWDEMVENGCRPNSFTYSILIKGFCGIGNAQEGVRILEEMISKGCLPNKSTYTMLIDGLRSEGKEREVVEVLSLAMSSKDIDSDSWDVFFAKMVGELDKGIIVLDKILAEDVNQDLAQDVPTNVNSLGETICKVLEKMASKLVMLRTGVIVACSAVQETSTSTVAADENTEAKPAPKTATAKPKAPAKAPVKNLPQMMEEDIIPALKAILEAQEDITDIELSFEDNKLEGSFAKKGIPYAFWAFFPKGLTGPKGFSLSSYGWGASTVEPFLVDEKKITAKHVVFWVEKRLAAQGIIPVWKD